MNGNNYFNDWSKRFIGDGLRSIKLVLGLALSFIFAQQNFILGLIFFAWVVVESFLDKK